jgi:hypothetical protein
LEQVKKAALAADAALDKAMGANRHTLDELKATIRGCRRAAAGGYNGIRVSGQREDN